MPVVRPLLAVALLALAGCPPADKKTQEPSCSKVGQTCTFAPGKLGTCVKRDDCTGADAACFDCQSQH
jgi:hypothetical protein